MKKLSFHPLFVVMVVLFVVLGFGSIVFGAFVALLVHESGHALMAWKYGKEIKKLYLLPFGASLNLISSDLSCSEEILIAVMGPIFSIGSAIICVCFWWIFPSIYGVTQFFVWSCVALFTVNILPAFPLDGGRVACALITSKFGFNKAKNAMIWLNAFFACAFFVLFATSISTSVNLSFGFMSFFLIQGMFENKFSSQYGKMCFYAQNKKFCSQIVLVKTFAVTPQTTVLSILHHMSKTKLNQVIICFPSGKMKSMNDVQFQIICERYSLCTKIKDIFSLD